VNSCQIDFILRYRFYQVHHPADIGKASAAFGILGCTLAATELLSGADLFHDQGTAVGKDILPYIF
jgi:hypothetical protein